MNNCSKTYLQQLFWLLCVVSMTLVCASWSGVSDSDQDHHYQRLLPKPPQYDDSTQWYIKWKAGPADLFYIISTETGDYVVDGDTCHYANTYDRSTCPRMMVEMRAVDSLFGGNNNYFSPYYRQITLESWASMDTALQRIPLALSDVRRSWDYYLTHFNQGRPFILAGFSQGAHAMLDLMRRMPDSIASRMVAAYVIGYKVTQEDLDSCPIIRAAQGATDVGVTICYNSVRAPECAIPVVSGGNLLCINPVNWRTDTVSARFGDTLTARCHPESHLVVVEGYKQKRILPIFGVEGNYHDRELKFYYPHIRQNMADRVAAFLRQQHDGDVKRDNPSVRPKRQRYGTRYRRARRSGTRNAYSAGD